MRIIARAIVLAATIAPSANAQTLGELTDSLRMAVQRYPSPVVAAWGKKLDSLAQIIEEKRARDLTLDQATDAVANRSPTFVNVARLRRVSNATADKLPANFTNGLQEVGNNLLTEIENAGVAAKTVEPLFTPVIALQKKLENADFARAESRLNRYDIKYGPSSPALNGVEVILNYALQFVPLPFDSPSPIELVASYSPTGATASSAQWRSFRLIANTRVGVRVYDFDRKANTKSLVESLRPTYYSLGYTGIADLASGALPDPLHSNWRPGGFVGLGSLYLAYTGVRGKQLVFGRNGPILPYLF